jgi:hypothetical protein
VQLLGVLIGHCAYLYRAVLGPIRPPLALRPTATHHRLHSPRLHPYTATPAARDSNLDSGNHEMSRLPVVAYLEPASGWTLFAWT